MSALILYPDSAADDLPALSGTLPSTTVTAAELLLSLRLTTTPAGATTQFTGAGPGSKVGSHVYSSLLGTPGSTAYWVPGTHSLALKITSITPSTGGSSLSEAQLLPRLHRTTAAGAGQERIKAGGIALGDPISATFPSGAAGALGGTGINLLTGSLGTYTFTWASVAAMWGNSGAAINANDRVSLELVFTYITTGGGIHVIDYEIASANTTYTTPYDPSPASTVGTGPRRTYISPPRKTVKQMKHHYSHEHHDPYYERQRRKGRPS